MPFGPYALAGWKLESDFELPELHAWNQDCGAAYPLRFERAEGPAAPGPKGLTLREDGVATLRIAGHAAFEVAASGNRVLIYGSDNADPLLLRAHLYGSVLAILCYKRGLLPLHGAAVLIGSGAILLSGPSGAGKSTLAAALVQRGHVLLSDDICPLEFRMADTLLWPTLGRVKLLDDAVAALGLASPATYSRSARGMKGNFRMAALAHERRITSPLTVQAIWALEEPAGDQIGCRRLDQKQAFAALDSRVHRAKMGRLLGAAERILFQTCRAAQTIPVYRLSRPRALKRLPETAAFLERACEKFDNPAGQNLLLTK